VPSRYIPLILQHFYCTVPNTARLVSTFQCHMCHKKKQNRRYNSDCGPKAKPLYVHLAYELRRRQVCQSVINISTETSAHREIFKLRILRKSIQPQSVDGSAFLLTLLYCSIDGILFYRKRSKKAEFSSKAKSGFIFFCSPLN
jgi:hypothetical protein